MDNKSIIFTQRIVSMEERERYVINKGPELPITVMIKDKAKIVFNLRSENTSN